MSDRDVQHYQTVKELPNGDLMVVDVFIQVISNTDKDKKDLERFYNEFSDDSES